MESIKLQNEMNSLVEKRLALKRQMESLKEDKKDLGEEMKTNQREMEVIDKLLREKLDEMRALREKEDKKKL